MRILADQFEKAIKPSKVYDVDEEELVCVDTLLGYISVVHFKLERAFDSHGVVVVVDVYGVKTVEAVAHDQGVGKHVLSVISLVGTALDNGPSPPVIDEPVQALV